MKLVSVNVGLPQEVHWRGRTVLTSIWKAPVEGRVRVNRLNLEGDRQSDLSVHGGPEKAVEAMISAAVDRMYAIDDTNRFLEVTYQNGDKEILYFKDFSSGAMIENIVRRAKKLSIKRQIENGDKGISTQDLLDSIRQEFREHEDLPNTTNPDDWAKISGKKGERIVFVRTILAEGDEPHGGRQIERVQTGQYL